MSKSRHQRIKELFLAAHELTRPEREDYLDAACAGDSELRAEVETLLAEDSDLEIDGLSAEGPRPDEIGQYRVVQILGTGGMGVVYEAEQRHPRRNVALKVIRPELANPKLRRRFEFEAEVLGQLRHPGIAQIYEAGATEKGELFFAMELVVGSPLSEYARGKRLDISQKLELLARVCDGVHHAHQRGVIHRDLKPGNILVDAQGQPKVLDFGVARATDGDMVSVTQQTEIGQIVGTIPYMSPEQAAGQSGELDTRSDVYALGVILYELLTGEMPYSLQGKLMHEALRTIQEQEPQRLSSWDRALRGDVETIALKALEKDKERRYGSAAELSGDLRRHLQHEPIEARPMSAVYQLRKFAKRNRALVASAAVIMITLSVALVLVVGALWEAQEARDLSESHLREAESVNDFLTEDLLASVDPRNNSNPDIPMREVLDRASENIAERFADTPRVEAKIRHVVGVTYTNLGEDAIAVVHLRRAVALRREFLGNEHDETLQSINSLAICERNNGNLDAAEKLFHEALETCQVVWGEDHVGVVSVLNNLALVVRARGRRKESAELYERAFHTAQRIFPKENAKLITYRVNLANAKLGFGEHDAAEALYQEALAVCQELLHQEHPLMLATLDGLARVAARRGESELAVDRLQELLAIRQAVQGERHPETLHNLNSLGAVQYRAGNYDEAWKWFEQCFQLRSETLGAAHRDTRSAREQMARVRHRQKRYEEAAELFRTSYEQGLVSDPRGQRTLRAGMRIAGSLIANGEVAAAAQYCREVIPQQLEEFGPGHRDLRTSLGVVGQVVEFCLEHRQLDLAQQLLEALLDSFDEFAAESTQRRSLVEQLVGVLEAKGHGEEALHWKKQLGDS